MKRHLLKISWTFPLFGVLLFQQCGTTKSSSTASTDTKEISYTADIRPIMLVKCAPCHFPETGRKKLLHTHEATVDNAKDILFRVQLPKEDKQYMPFKGKRESLTKEEIVLFKTWINQGAPI